MDKIDFIENVYLNRINAGDNEQAAINAATIALAARMRVDPELYGIIGEYIDETHRGSAERIAKSWIENFESRGRVPYSEQGRAGGAETPDTMTATQTAPKSYATEAEAEAALERGEIKSKDIILIAGRRAEVP